MSERYRIRPHTDREMGFMTRPYRVERKDGWFRWEMVNTTYDPSSFDHIVRRDMENRKEASKADFVRNSFKPIHAVAYWLLTVPRRLKGEAPELIVQIDTKG